MIVTFKSGKQRLVGDLEKAGKQLIIISHGLSSNRKHLFLTYLARQFNKAGYSTLRFDYTGRGDSQGDYSDGVITKYVQDLNNAIKLAKKHSKSIGLIGHSLGAAVSLLCAEEPAVRAVISLSGVYDPPSTIRAYLNSGLIRKIQAIRFGDNFFKDLLNHDFKSAVRGLSKPLLIVNGDRDNIVTQDQAIQMYEAANEPKKLDIIKDCGHNYWKLNQLKQVTNLAIDWFNKYLQP